MPPPRSLRLSRVACLGNAANPISLLSLKDTADAGRALRVSIQALQIRGPDEFGQVFSAMLKERAETLIVAPDTMLLAERQQIAGFAATNRLPSIPYTGHSWTLVGSWPTGRRLPTHTGTPRAT